MITLDRKNALAALGALSQETRLEIFRLLIQAGPDGLAAGSIAESLSVAPANLSFHLSHLSQAGLTVQRREGRSIIYAADYGRMNSLLGFLTENCCGRPANAAASAPLCAPTTKAATATKAADTPILITDPDRESGDDDDREPHL